MLRVNSVELSGLAQHNVIHGLYLHRMEHLRDCGRECVCVCVYAGVNEVKPEVLSDCQAVLLSPYGRPLISVWLSAQQSFLSLLS